MKLTLTTTAATLLAMTLTQSHREQQPIPPLDLRSYGEGVNHALAHYVLLELEQALQRTNRPRAAMIQKVCDRLDVPCTVAGVREVLTKTKTP